MHAHNDVHAPFPPHPGRGVKSLVYLLAGSLLGMVFGASSLYLVLKVGLTVSASIPIAVLAISVLKRLGGSTILENNIVQTAGTAAAQTAFMCVLLAAFDMLRLGQGVVGGAIVGGPELPTRVCLCSDRVELLGQVGCALIYAHRNRNAATCGQAHAVSRRSAKAFHIAPDMTRLESTAMPPTRFAATTRRLCTAARMPAPFVAAF